MFSVHPGKGIKDLGIRDLSQSCVTKIIVILIIHVLCKWKLFNDDWLFT